MTEHGEKRVGDGLVADKQKRAKVGIGAPKKDVSNQKPKRKYFQGAGGAIPLNSRGFLVTCVASKEQAAAREAISLLSSYYEQIMDRDSKDDAGKASTLNISDELEHELATLQNPEQQSFKYHKVGVNGVLYISMPGDAGTSPGEILLRVAEDVEQHRECKSKLCMRFLPVDAVFHPSIEDVKKTSAKVIGPLFDSSEDAKPSTLAVVYEYRASTKLDRLGVIDAAMECIKRPPHKVDLKDAERSIIVQTVKNVCTIGLAHRYQHFAKYNFRDLVGAGEKQTDELKEKKVDAKSTKPVTEGLAALDKEAKPLEAGPKEPNSS